MSEKDETMRMKNDSSTDHLAAEGGTSAGSRREARIGRATADVGSDFGPYHIHEVLGRGGQGVVFRATDRKLGRDVALKILHDVDAAETLLRFRREAMIASKIEHPSLCRVYDAGEIDGQPFIAMQLVRGVSLAQKIKCAAPEASFFDIVSETAPSIVDDRRADRGKSSLSGSALRSGADEIKVVVEFFEKVARALHVIHEAGIVHRDIKPGNIMVTADNLPIVMDFGLARADDGSATLTHEGQIFGTPAYMSPEQLSRSVDTLDRRTDVWSLGVALYEVLSGERPFNGPTRESLYQAILTHEPARPESRRGPIPRDLEVVVTTALTKNRDRRYQSAEAFADDLLAVRERRPIAARPIGPIGRVVRWGRREPAKAALVALLFLTMPIIAALTTKYIADRDDRERLRMIDTEREKDIRLAEAFFHLSEGNVDRAPRIFEEVLAMPGRSQEAATGIVMALIAQGRSEEALAQLEKHKDILDGTWASKELKVRARRSSTSEPKGLLEPETAIDYYLSAEVEMNAGERGDTASFRRALRRAEQAILLSPTPRFLFYVQAIHAAAHIDDKDAVIAIGRAIEHHWPELQKSIYWRSFAYSMTKQHEAVVRMLDDYVVKHPDDFEAGVTLARSQRELGDPKACENRLRRILDVDKNHPGALAEMGWTLQFVGRFAEALEFLDRAALVSPQRSEIERVRAFVLASLGRGDEALATCEKLVAAGESSLELLTNYGDLLRTRKRYAEAVAVLERAVKAAPYDAPAAANYGRALYMNGERERGIAEMERALIIEPNLASARKGLATCRSLEGANAAAIEEFRKYLILVPDDAAAHASLGAAYLNVANYAAAAETLRTAVNLDPSARTARYNLAQALRGVGRNDESLVEFREVLKHNPEDAETRRNVGSLLYQRGDFEEALAVYMEAVLASPDDASFLADAGYTANALGKLHLAASLLERAIAKAEAAPALQSLVATYLDLEEYELAQKYETRRLESGTGEKKEPIVPSATLRWLDEKRRWDDAMAEIQKSGAAPSEDVLEDFAWWAARNGRPEAATSAYESLFRSTVPASPVGDRGSRSRSAYVRAALAGVRAANGLGDAEGLDPAARSRRLELAATWIGKAIDAIEKAYEDDAVPPATARRDLFTIAFDAELEPAFAGKHPAATDDVRAVFTKHKDKLSALIAELK